jgi:hypothetical protein
MEVSLLRKQGHKEYYDLLICTFQCNLESKLVSNYIRHLPVQWSKLM